MDPPAGTIAELHFHLPEIVLTELSGKTFEANQRLHPLRANRGHQRVERGLASRVAAFLNSPQNLQRRQIRRFSHDLNHLFPEIRDRAGPANLSFDTLPGIIDMLHRSVLRDAFYRTQRYPAQARYFGLRMTGLQQNLDFVSFQHRQHPPPSASGTAGA